LQKETVVESTIEFSAKVVVTPHQVARAFWEMTSSEQAQFFAELHDITEKESKYGLGEMQWSYMSEDIEANPKAKKQACAMMVWIFNRATNFLERLPS
jgi:ABC-type Na+ transport system ATPase subunit NatA